MIQRALAVALLFVSLPLVAQGFHHHLESSPDDDLRPSPCSKIFATPDLDANLQKVQMPVTGSDLAKRYFSQGMTELYGFNYEDALRNFRAAEAEDGTMAMAPWGIALAAGPNINIWISPDHKDPCRELAVQKSREAVSKAQAQPGITPMEKALISALPDRYTDPVMETVTYSVNMGRVWQAFPKNPDVSALYAESVFNLRPWGLFDNAKRPALDTLRVLGVLQDVVGTKSVGANHYWIHAVEAGPAPGSAIDSAKLLDELVPSSGHLLHMPSHIYQLTGDFAASVASNQRAVAVDRKQYQDACKGMWKEYSQNPKCPQLYYGHYLAHNLFFGSVSSEFLGRKGDALTWAKQTREHVQSFVTNQPGLQRYMTAPSMVLVMNRDWSTILDKTKEPEPPAECYVAPGFTPTGCHIVRAIWHWARGMAYTRSPLDLNAARAEYNEMAKQISETARTTPSSWGNNAASSVLAVADELLRARICWAGNRRDEAIEHLKLAVTREDALVYDEPPQWFAPTREALGAAYMWEGKFDPAIETFDRELAIHPKSGRALYGLMRALQGAGQASKAEEVKKEFEKAWKNADYVMTVDELW